MKFKKGVPQLKDIKEKLKVAIDAVDEEMDLNEVEEINLFIDHEDNAIEVGINTKARSNFKKKESKVADDNVTVLEDLKVLESFYDFIEDINTPERVEAFNELMNMLSKIEDKEYSINLIKR